MGSYPTELSVAKEAELIPLPLRSEFQKGEIPLLRASGLTLVLDTPKGRGVFAKTDMSAGMIVDISPVLVLSPEENKEHISKTAVYHYTYNWPLPSSSSDHSIPTKTSSTPKTTQALPLGLGSLFNHSTTHQNIGWTRSVTTQTITYTTLRDIRAGEELCISYGDRLTFKDVEVVEEEKVEPEVFLGRIDLD